MLKDGSCSAGLTSCFWKKFLFHYPKRVICAFSSNRMSFIVVVASLHALETKRHSCVSGGINDFTVLQIC